MPKVNPKALLEIEEVKRTIEAAKAKGPLEAALLAWLYEFGSRASEPGLQHVNDVDLRLKRARVVHLKKGASFDRNRQDWDALLPLCRELLPPWLEARPSYLVDAGQKLYLFPSRSPGDCTACKGTGKRSALQRGVSIRVPCHHCAGTGKRWGLSRHEVYHLVTELTRQAGVPIGHRHPHTFRHSLITHLLEGGTAAGVIQERVGHSNVATTLGYVRATKTARLQLENALSGVYKKKDGDNG
jgi:integrase